MATNIIDPLFAAVSQTNHFSGTRAQILEKINASMDELEKSIEKNDQRFEFIFFMAIPAASSKLV